MTAFAELRTLRELEMIECSAHIRAKPGWFEKMHDAGIVERWTQEAVALGLTEAQVRYLLAELAHYAALWDAWTDIEMSGVYGVRQSDTLVDDKLAARLREAVRALEDVPEAEPDWHPGSDGQVLNLVHPSLFCLVRDVSGARRSLANPPNQYSKHEFSGKFQWLLTDVGISEEGEVTVVQRLAGNPRHHGPVIGEGLGRFTEPHRGRHRERQARRHLAGGSLPDRAADSPRVTVLRAQPVSPAAERRRRARGDKPAGALRNEASFGARVSDVS